MAERRVAPPGDVEVVLRGDIPDDARAAAERMVGTLIRYAHRPVLHARVRLTRSADPALTRPVIAQVNLDVNGGLVRAQVAAPTTHEAIDLVHDRMRHRLEHLARYQEDRPDVAPVPQAHEWRHGQEPTHRPDYFPRPAEQRRLVRHKAFEPRTSTPDEAAFDMDLMDYDFHLFTDAASGRDAVLYRAGPTGYRIAYVGGPPANPPAPVAVPLTVSPRPAAVLAPPEAIEQLNGTGRPFLFFADPATGRGRLVYRRYDGHYGLITPAG